jgi:hypothetical protein
MVVLYNYTIRYFKEKLMINIIIALLLMTQNAYSESAFYFLCGSDEDGCFEGQEQYCACIPVNSSYANQAYCLDFDNMTCNPLSLDSDCHKNLIYNNQGSCIATLFQSEPYPPCKIVTYTFCQSHNIHICDENGNL